jgi:chemotaxis protein CheD
MEHMINDILKHGGRRERLEVKVFGGGNVLPTMTEIGTKNIHFVR